MTDLDEARQALRNAASDYTNVPELANSDRVCEALEALIDAKLRASALSAANVRNPIARGLASVEQEAKDWPDWKRNAASAEPHVAIPEPSAANRPGKGEGSDNHNPHRFAWRCSCCGELLDDETDPRWRWEGTRWEHKCEGIHPQAGHQLARCFGPRSDAPAEVAGERPAAPDAEGEEAGARAMYEAAGPVSAWNNPWDKMRPEHRAAYVRAYRFARAPLVAEIAELRRKYDELIMGVGNAYPGETRHETALRHIRAAENQDHPPQRADVREELGRDSIGGSDG